MAAATPNARENGDAGRRKRRAPEEIRALLLAAAREEFKHRGFAGATTAAIARRADVAEIQMFRYYPSKAELFREAVFAPLIEHFRKFNERYSPTATDPDSIMAGARQYVRELQAFLGENAEMLVSLFVAQRYAAPGASETKPLPDLQAYFEECAATMSQRSIAARSADPAMVVRVTFAALLGCITYRDWMFPDAAENRAEIDNVIMEFILAGIGPHSDLGPQ